VSPGDVFVLRDTINKEKDTPPDNTRIIRFQRPAIVVSTGFKICTVIPLTTKENSPEISYPIKVSSDVNSRALFSQITTVDNFRLGKKLGVIDPLVFKDLVNVYTNYILGKPKIYLSRSIAIPTYGMDMIAFDNFAYYRDNSNHERIILSIGNGTSTYYLNTVEPKPMEFPVPENEPKTTVHGVIGKDIELSSVHFLSKEYRETTWTCIGYETYECNRELISDTINEIFGITPVKLAPDKMDTIMEYHLASTISRAFKTSLYLRAFDFIMNSDLEELFSDKIKAKPGSSYTIGRVLTKSDLASGQKQKKFTMCTRTVYLGADFYSTCAKSYILSDANVSCLSIDISLDLPQILGRQRLIENPWKNEAEFYYTLPNKETKENAKELGKKIQE
jgi:mRNA-degrading endonuclease toxin of MazEF toxin-antitoxin module